MVMLPPLLVTTKFAVLVFTPAQDPATANEGGVEGVFVGVLVGVFSGVLVGVAVGLSEQEPVTFRVTDERNEVLYVTVTLALPAP